MTDCVDSSRQRSFYYLSLLCFSLADVRDGLGPFFGVYLQGMGWRPDAIGYVMTAGGFAGLLCVAPLGALVDNSRHKRSILAAAVAIIVATCGIIFFWQGALCATTSKILSCAAAAAIMPALNGITLGLTGQKAFPGRLGVNEAWSHAGNAATACAGGIIGYQYGIPGVFMVMAFMGLLSLYSLKKINPQNIDYDVARGLTASAPVEKSRSLRLLFTNKAFWCLV